jgi:(2Fe-2S) ferredoxin
MVNRDARRSNLYGDAVLSYSSKERNPELVSGGASRKHLLVCTHPGPDGCYHKGGFDVKQAFNRERFERNLDNVRISSVRSLGFCDRGPVAVVYPDEVWYEVLTPEDVPRIVDHLVNDAPVEELSFDPDFPDGHRILVVCTFLSACGPKGGGEVLRYFKRKERDRDSFTVVQSYGCLKDCSMGPLGVLYPDGDWFANMSKESSEDVWENEVLNSRPSTYRTGETRTEPG